MDLSLATAASSVSTIRSPVSPVSSVAESSTGHSPTTGQTSMTGGQSLPKARVLYDYDAATDFEMSVHCQFFLAQFFFFFHLAWLTGHLTSI
jgi:hypothetical protein